VREDDLGRVRRKLENFDRYNNSVAGRRIDQQQQASCGAEGTFYCTKALCKSNGIITVNLLYFM
jgi:hypothetical protein